MKTLKNKLLLLLALCCSLFACQTTRADSPSAGGRVDVSALTEKVDGAIKDLSVNELAGNVNKQFSERIREAISKLKSAKKQLSDADKSEGDDQNPRARFHDAESSIRAALSELEAAGAIAKSETLELLKPIKSNLDSILSSLNPTTVSPAAPAPSTKLPNPEVQDDEWVIADVLSYGIPVLQVATVLLVVGLLIYCAIGLKTLRRTTDGYFGGLLPQTLNGVKVRQDELAKQVEAAAVATKNIDQRLGEVHTEIRLMSRTMQQANLAGNRPTNFPASYSEPSASPVNDGLVFPIAADELLRQMQAKSVVVKRDFQNDMLVSDPDGKGELVLIRDSYIAEELQPLFIVPRVTQFQMRQEYYNFYEKYYDCANPESGSVWILDPAVVEKVVGGWELREKGRLEVR